MKIAVVGKGGSGKSSTSWLLSEFISRKAPVLAIDADHNMDLAGIYGVEVSDNTHTFHRSHEMFREYVGLEGDSKWFRIILDNEEPRKFEYQSTPDTLTQHLIHPIKSRLDLQIVGLGGDDVMFSDRCAHGHSAPLKFYLALLDEGKGHVIVDGVAGADMVNYGLFAGCDMMLGVVEPHINSVKVFRQLTQLAQKLELPLFAVVNKPRKNDLYDQIYQEFGDQIVGEFGYDEAIIDYDFASLQPKTMQALENLWKAIEAKPQGGGLARLKRFEQMRLELSDKYK